MNKDNLQNIVGGLLMLLISVIGFVVKGVIEDVGILNHTMDLHVSEANQRLDQIESELDDIWIKYNSDDEKDKKEMQQEFDFAIRLMNDNTKVAMDLKDFKIEYYKHNRR